MKRQWIATGLAVFILGWQATAAIAQTNMKNGYLNTQMRQALCVQDWAKAVRIIDEMKRVSSVNAQNLNYYRARLVILREHNASISTWPTAEYCSGRAESAPNTATSTPALPISPAMPKGTIPLK